MDAMLTIDQIMNADDLPTKVVPVPAWGGAVKIRMLTKAQQYQVRKTAIVDGEFNDQQMEMGLLVESIIEPQMSRDHMQMLANKNADVVDEILAEVFSLSAMDKEAVANARDEFPGGSDEVDGVSPGGEAGDDSPEAAAGDAAS